MDGWTRKGGIGTRVLAAALASSASFAAPVADPAQPGPDFAVQGEYQGKVKVGAQVIAEGDGKFAVVFLPGGLPGAGWDGKKKIQASAKTEGAKTMVSGAGWNAVISDGKLIGKSPDGVAFTLSRIVRKSPTLEAKPPKGAVVLFDGTSAGGWENGKLVEDKLLHCGATSRKALRDFKLHLEFRLPFLPEARGQERGNSGVYVQGRYEVQLLDSFGLEGKDSECGGVFAAAAPSVNMCFPPLSWQTYDIEFEAARFNASGTKVGNARLTVTHNGVKVHDRLELKGNTPAGREESDTPGPIQLQDHGCPVVFRNIWAVETR